MPRDHTQQRTTRTQLLRRMLMCTRHVYECFTISNEFHEIFSFRSFLFLPRILHVNRTCQTQYSVTSSNEAEDEDGGKNSAKCQHVDRNYAVEFVCGRVTLNKTREKERERFASTRNVNNCLFYGACNSSIHPPLLIPVKKPNDFIIILWIESKQNRLLLRARLILNRAIAFPYGFFMTKIKPLECRWKKLEILSKK